MDIGFYHPDRGYWQAIDGDAAALLPTYPEGTVEVPLKPGDGYTWDNGQWVPGRPALSVPDGVSSRQFKMQLFISGLKAQVETWVAAQDELVQISYVNSGTFVRSEPMMQQGFADLGFTAEQIDQFFVDASKL